MIGLFWSLRLPPRTILLKLTWVRRTSLSASCKTAHVRPVGIWKIKLVVLLMSHFKLPATFWLWKKEKDGESHQDQTVKVGRLSRRYPFLDVAAIQVKAFLSPPVDPTKHQFGIIFGIANDICFLHQLKTRITEPSVCATRATIKFEASVPWARRRIA